MVGAGDGTGVGHVGPPQVGGQFGPLQLGAGVGVSVRGTQISTFWGFEMVRLALENKHCEQIKFETKGMTKWRLLTALSREVTRIEENETIFV